MCTPLNATKRTAAFAVYSLAINQQWYDTVNTTIDTLSHKVAKNKLTEPAIIILLAALTSSMIDCHTEQTLSRSVNPLCDHF